MGKGFRTTDTHPNSQWDNSGYHHALYLHGHTVCIPQSRIKENLGEKMDMNISPVSSKNYFWLWVYFPEINIPLAKYMYVILHGHRRYCYGLHKTHRMDICFLFIFLQYFNRFQAFYFLRYSGLYLSCVKAL